MLTLLGVLLWLIGIVLLLVLLVLATPIHLTLSAELGPTRRFCLWLRPFGGVIPQLRVLDTARRRKPRESRKEKAPKRARRGRRKHKAGGWRLPEGARWRLFRALPDFLRREIRRIRIERVQIDGVLGLGDPADTGRLFGYIMPLNHALHLPRTRIDLRPDFEQLRLEGRAEAALHLIPLSLLVPVLRLAWRVLVVRR